MLRSIGAVLAGFFTMAVVVGLGTAAASKLLLSPPAAGKALQPTPTYLAVNLALSGLAALLGGLTAARLSNQSPMGHAGALALLVLIMALITAFTAGGSPGESNQPGWYPFVLAILGPLGVIVGGWLSRQI